MAADGLLTTVGIDIKGSPARSSHPGGKTPAVRNFGDPFLGHGPETVWKLSSDSSHELPPAVPFTAHPNHFTKPRILGSPKSWGASHSPYKFADISAESNRKMMGCQIFMLCMLPSRISFLRYPSPHCGIRDCGHWADLGKEWQSTTGKIPLHEH